MIKLITLIKRVRSPRTVCRHGGSAADAELKASIAARGLLQNPIVRTAAEGRVPWMRHCDPASDAVGSVALVRQVSPLALSRRGVRSPCAWTLAKAVAITRSVNLGTHTEALKG